MPKILIIESDPDMKDIYERVFSQADFEVDATILKEEALKAMEKEKFNVVLLDIFLDGFEIIEKIRKSELNSKAKIIVCTVENSVENKNKALALGANVFLDKLKYNPMEIAGKTREILA
jgi:DNA-binding response OmpR family regulator